MGVGPGDEKYLTPMAIEIIERSDVVIASKRAKDSLPKISGKLLELNASNLDRMVECALDLISEGKNVSFASTGDPCFSGLLKTLSRRGVDKSLMSIIPGISSFQLMAARLKINWDEIKAIVNFHDGVEESKKHLLVKTLYQGGDVVVLPNPISFLPQEIAKFLLANAIPSRTIAYVCERLGYREEKLVEGTLEELSKISFHPLSLLFIPSVRSASQPDIVRREVSDRLIERAEGIPFTKREIRAIATSKLELSPGDLAVDVGCGTGVVSLEMAMRVYPNGMVFAIDKEPLAVELTKRNKEKFNLSNLIRCINSDALEALDHLPEVDAIFVGGGGGKLEKIIEKARLKLRSGGRIVVNTILLESAASAIKKLSSPEFTDLDVTEICVAKGRKLEQGTMMLTQNPVTIVSARKC